MSPITPTDTEIAATVAAIEPWQTELYRDLHRHPELSGEEHRTAAEAARILVGLGCEVHTGVGGTAVVAIIDNGAGPVVALRADMDALPVTEQTDLPWASTTEVMHACGHDAHLTWLLGAARVLVAHRDRWAGRLILLCQPAEETGTGALAMVNAGLSELVGPVDVVLAQHLMRFPAGEVRVCAGPVLTMSQHLTITVFGRGGHGSAPHLAVDPVVLAAMIVVRLQTVVAREVAPGTFAVVSVGSIEAGSKGNVIPDDAVLRVNLRAYDPGVIEHLVSAVKRIVAAECQASGSPRPALVEHGSTLPVTHNDAATATRVREALTAQLPGQVVDLEPQTASEDFSHLPDGLGAASCYWGVGAVDPQEWARAEREGTLAEIPGNHSAHFAPHESALGVGTRSMVAAALAWLGR